MPDSKTRQVGDRPAPSNFDHGQPSPTLPRPLLHHVQLKTTRLDEMAEWYCFVTGCVVVFQGQGGAWLTNDDANHRIALVTSPRLEEDTEKVARAGLHHTAWEYGNLGELLDTYVRLREAEILPHRTVNHGPIISFYYLDPDGNSVELQSDNYGDWRESVKFFSTPEFAEDPYGPGVDPDEMVIARDGGASDEELQRRTYADEFPNRRPNDRRFPV